MINLIVAVDAKLGMAGDHGIPWQGQVPSDSAYFRRQTRQGLIVMGYRTYEEFDTPLHDRTNFVVAREGTELRDGFQPVPDLESFLHAHGDDTVWIVGGGGLYAASIEFADQLFVTQLEGDFDCTTFFPEFHDRFSLTSESAPIVENGISFTFQIWRGGAGTTG
jgi:dihydrofolate reductase